MRSYKVLIHPAQGESREYDFDDLNDALNLAIKVATHEDPLAINVTEHTEAHVFSYTQPGLKCE